MTHSQKKDFYLVLDYHQRKIAFSFPSLMLFIFIGLVLKGVNLLVLLGVSSLIPLYLYFFLQYSKKHRLLKIKDTTLLLPAAYKLGSKPREILLAHVQEVILFGEALDYSSGDGSSIEIVFADSTAPATSVSYSKDLLLPFDQLELANSLVQACRLIPGESGIQNKKKWVKSKS